MMKILNLDLSHESYPIFIGEQLLSEKKILSKFILGEQVLIISNKILAPLYLEKVQILLSDYETYHYILPDGEVYKTLAEVNKIWDKLLKLKFNRSATLVALGGGVVGDLSGFAAACYQRGIRFIQIPTTLLAQVDASVGGKTGVNHTLGKNMIGAFYQPKCVIIDIDTLDTLDDRQFSAGMAEVIKYALLDDASFLNFLEINMDTLLKRDKKLLAEVIYRSCQNKAKIVAQDELEAGKRALLNLGHTFGHALENALGYGVYLHGEAVAIGIMMIADFSTRLGLLTSDETERIKVILKRAHLPTTVDKKINKRAFLLAMSRDKKVKNNTINLVLLKKIGVAFISCDYDKFLLDELIKDYIN